MIYCAVLPNSVKSYVGETTVGLEQRGATHTRQSCKVVGKMRINQVMSKLGVHRLVWLPLRTWNVNERTTKIQRLAMEGEFIWLWDPDLN